MVECSKSRGDTESDMVGHIMALKVKEVQEEDEDQFYHPCCGPAIPLGRPGDGGVGDMIMNRMMQGGMPGMPGMMVAMPGMMGGPLGGGIPGAPGSGMPDIPPAPPAPPGSGHDGRGGGRGGFGGRRRDPGF